MGNESEDSWKDAIKEKLFEVYGAESPSSSDQNCVVGLLYFLDRSDADYSTKEPGTVSPFWRTLRMALSLKDKSAFKLYADKMMKDSEECKNNSHLIAMMGSIYEQMAEPSNAFFHEEVSLSNDLAKCSFTDMKGSQHGLGMAVARTWDDKCVSLVNKTRGTVVMMGLAAAHVTWECYRSLSCWYKGEISGRRCVKICVDSIAEIGAGIGGGFAGALIGSMIFPVVGGFIGGIVGGLTAGAAAKLLTERLTEMIFDLPRDEAVEKAYKFLGVHHKDSNNVINTAFRKKALMYHPDKGGNPADFHQLQMQMTLIKIVRGDTFQQFKKCK